MCKCDISDQPQQQRTLASSVTTRKLPHLLVHVYNLHPKCERSNNYCKTVHSIHQILW